MTTNDALIARVRTYRDAWGPNPGVDHKGPRPPFSPAPGGSLRDLLDDVIDALGGTK